MGMAEYGCLRRETPMLEIEYFRFGEGKTDFVILPGLSLHSVMPAGEAVARQYAAIGEHCRCWLFDPPRTLPENARAEGLAEDIALAMTELGIRGAVLFGCSFGGMLAQWIAAKHPELVGKLILGSSSAGPSEGSNAVFNRWIALAAAGDVVALNRDMNSRVYSEAYRQRFAEAFAAAEGSGTPEELRRFMILAHACRDSESRVVLDRVTCPALVIGAERDLVLGAEGSVEIAEKLGCPLFLYSECGHAAYDEAEDYTARLLQFLQTT